MADLTYVTAVVGFVYAAITMDTWSRRIIGYAMSRRIDARLTLAALNAAIRMREPPPGCVHHGDRGSQYAAEKYRDRLCEAKLVGSMGRRGDPYDSNDGELDEDAAGRRRLASYCRGIDYYGCPGTCGAMAF